MLRLSGSIPANNTNAWRKRRYVAAFAGKLRNAKSNASKTKTWIQFESKWLVWAGQERMINSLNMTE